jgi:hypothetical protein
VVEMLFAAAGMAPFVQQSGTQNARTHRFFLFLPGQGLTAFSPAP